MAYIYQTRAKKVGKNHKSKYVVLKDYDGRYSILHKLKNIKTGSSVTAGFLGGYKYKTTAIKQARLLQKNLSVK